MCYWGHYPETHLAAFESFYFIFFLPNAACLTTIFAAAEELPEWVSHYNNFKDQKQPDGSFRLLRQIRYTIWGLSSLYIPFYRQTWDKLTYHSVLARRFYLVNITPARFGNSSVVQPLLHGFQILYSLGTTCQSITKQFSWILLFLK